LEKRALKRKYTLEETKKTGCALEIVVFAYDTKEDFEWASVNIAESGWRHGRIRQPIRDRIYLALENEGEFLFGNGEGDEIGPFIKEDVVFTSKDTAYDCWGGMRLFLVQTPAYEQESDAHLDDLWN
jgi:hypothetical protein